MYKSNFKTNGCVCVFPLYLRSFSYPLLENDIGDYCFEQEESHCMWVVTGRDDHGSHDVQPYKRVCYFTNWAQYRTAPMTFTAENVDPFLCTHIMYAFGKVVGNTIDAYEWNDKGAGEIQQFTILALGQYERIMNLRMLNPNLKILLAIGGWTHGTAPFTAVVVDPNNIAAFAANTLEYLKTYKFDGLDLDWEYPGGNGSPPEDKQRFTSLVQKLRQVFNDDGAVNNRPPMLLTAAVAAGKSTIDNAYEVDLISKDLDFINLMSYDLHGSWEVTTGHHSALYGRSGEVGTAASMNVDYSVNYWISLGAPPHKLVLGLGLYGRSFTLSSSSNTFIGAPAAGAGSAGPYTGEAGLLAFYEVCYNLKFNGWTREWHSEHQVPYAYSGNQWIGYDDTESFNVKIDYIIAKGLGGGMVWSLDQDDFSNSCGDGSYPLMNVLRFRLSTIPPTSTPQPCVDGQMYGDSCDPKIYYQCASGVAYQFQCAAGTVWDERIKNCNWDYLVLTSPTPCGCGPPPVCTDGQFYADKCDMKVYYQCAHGIPYPYECNTGTVWDTVISSCNWDYAVPNRAPPTGSDCTSQGPITTGTTLKNTEQTTLAPAKLTTNINLSTVGPLLTTFPTTLDQTTQFQSTLLPKTDLVTSSVSCGAPKTCVDGQLYGESCDPKIYYQCASGVAYQFQCAAGTVWDERIKNCNWDYLVLTSPTPCGCGPPSTCTDGQFYADKCDMKVYYQCAHGIPYPYECNTGTVWDTVINNCNWDYAVPNRAPPTGSDCTSQGPLTTGTTPQNTEHMTSVAAKMTSVGGSLTPFSTTVDQTNSYFLSTIFPKTNLFTTTGKTLSFVETSPPNLITTYSSTLISSIGSLKTDQHTTPTSLTTTTQQQVTTLLHTATSDSTPSQAQQHVTPQSTNTTTNGLSSQTLQQLATKTSIPSTDSTQSQIQQQTTTKSRIAVTDSTQAQSSQQTQTLSPIAVSDSTRQQTTQSHSAYSNTKDTTSASHITNTGNPFSKTDSQTTTQPSGITNSVWSSQIPQQTTTNAQSTSDPTPIQTTTSPSTSDHTPIKTSTSPSTSDHTPIKTSTSPSTSDHTPIKTSTSPSTSDTTPIKTSTSPSTSDHTPIKTSTSPSTSDHTPIKTTTSPSTSDPTPQQTTTESQTTTCGRK
uniref:Chitotriosidase-1 n=1 Tax=Magallana gigas TaxID=29159 RepID=K1PN75_MAGGI